jgi:hypothetical protein
MTGKGKISIHDSGEDAVDALSTLIKNAGHGAEKGPRSGPRAGKVPDLTLKHRDKGDLPLEVKQASSSVPQLRPIAYKVTVVRAEHVEGKELEWWVIPPDDLLRMAIDHPGQHCISSFECMNPGKPNKKWDKWKCESKQVVSQICQAYDQGEKSPLKKIAEQFKNEIQALYEGHKKVLQDLPLAEPSVGAGSR